MDERLYEAAVRGDVDKFLDLLNEVVFMQAAEPFLDRVMRECSGKDNPLHLGALFGRVEFVREISSRKPEFARQLNSKGQSPLHLAAERGHVEVVKVLLETDADVCFVRDRDGRIPLHLAVIKGRDEVIEELVKAKNITAWLLTDEREPILHLCAKHDQFYALKKLVSLVRDDEFVRLKDSNDNTILHLLSAKKKTEMIKFLLDNSNIELEINALNVDKLTTFDVVYLAQLEPGFLGLKKLLGGKGAKRSSELSLGLPTNFSSKRTDRDSKWLERMEPSFLVLAALVVTLTFEALVINPPGGIFQDDCEQPGSNNTNPKQNPTGEPILLYKDPIRYNILCFLTIMGFSAALVTIATILSKNQFSTTGRLRVFKYSTFIALFSLSAACSVPLYPRRSDRIFVSSLFVYVAFCLFYFLYYVGPLIYNDIADLWFDIMERQRAGEGTQRSVVIRMTTDHQNS